MCRPIPARPHVLDALLDSFEQWQGHRSEPPRIAILDWKEVPTVSEFRIFERYFRDRGIDCRIVDPRDVEFDNGGLRAGDFPFNLIYKRVLISELLERGGADHPVIRAVQTGGVCMVNGFRCKILYKKASFAVLSDERNARAVSPRTERQAIADHIPWTRVVVERKTNIADQSIDLVPLCPGQPRAFRPEAERRIRRQGHRAGLDRGRVGLGSGGCDGPRDAVRRAGAGQPAARSLSRASTTASCN